MTDTLRDGRFVVLGLLGEGAQGRTFDGLDRQGGTHVAIKQFDVRGARAWKDVELAEREARVLKTLSHPKLPRYIDHFEEDGILYLVTEKVEGASLESLRRQGAPFGEADAVRLLEDASDILDYLHGRSPPVVHRDIKPANVLRRPDGSYAFVDFGAVRDTLRPAGGSTVVGTFGYMAPEQFQGRAAPASDAYGVAATVVSLLAGSEPEDLPHRGLAIDVRVALRGRATERMIGILEELLEPDPDRRAALIGPLLRRPDAFRADSLRASVRHSSRQEARRARQEARDMAREWRQDRRRRHGVPWPLEVLFTLVFAAGLVAVAVATQVVVPLVLRILSVFLARRALSAAADAVQEAGGSALRAMAQSRRWMRGEPPGTAGPQDASPPRPDGAAAAQTRVAPVQKVRVANPGQDEGALEDEDEPAGRAKR